MKNNLSRRQFFKKAVKATLPILGATALFNVSLGLMAQEQTQQGGCNTSCSANCSYQCVNTCRTMCGNNCGGTCRMLCHSDGCTHTCAASCMNTCRSSAKMRADSILKDTTILKR